MKKIPKWSNYNDSKVKPLDPLAGSWPLHYFRRNWRGQFTDSTGQLISLKIKNPRQIDFYGIELDSVKNTLESLTEEQREIANYYSFGPPTKQLTPIIDRLIDTYNVTPMQAARILAATQAAVNDAMIINWHLKYVFDVARPDQIDPSIETVVPTPPFPAYPSGHATAAGCAEMVLSYFFPGEASRLKEIAEQCTNSRLYAGVHFPSDNEEGLRLGRQIGNYVVSHLKNELNAKGKRVDRPFKEYKEAILPPPPYEQVIPYPPSSHKDAVTPPKPRPFFSFF